MKPPKNNHAPLPAASSATDMPADGGRAPAGVGTSSSLLAFGCSYQLLGRTAFVWGRIIHLGIIFVILFWFFCFPLRIKTPMRDIVFALLAPPPPICKHNARMVGFKKNHMLGQGGPVANILLAW